ncbi:MAG: molybdate ABC transporter substrate-binding protein [Kangiellaceae bacterium]|nr:molybdate ABC transporter substrate-binding protein [Kangiellaceae bacterium]
MKSLVLGKISKYIRAATVSFAALLLCANGQAKTLHIATASNFLETARKIADEFEAQSEHSVRVSSGSSGKLFLQISNGAPFDLFLSADVEKPSLLIKDKLALADSLQSYAHGRLVIWFKNCDVSLSLYQLTGNSIDKIAIANPKLAPYGLASKQFLIKQKLWSRVQPKLVQPENISQVSQLVKIGVVDAAFISASHIRGLGLESSNCLLRLDNTDDPANLGYPPIDQQLVIISTSKNIPLARDFIRFMQTNKVHTLIKNMGYLVPDSVKITP